LPSAHRAASTLLSVTLLAVGSFAVDNPNDRSKKVDQLFAAFDTPRTPGCALGVIREGEFVHKRAYGAASLELSVPLTTRSAFVMGSISKQFTAASVVLAAEQGYLVLDDDVRKYIPELPDYGKTITLREMLHHTSGLRDLENLLDFSGRNQEDIHPFAELIDLITRQKELNFHPGEEYLYSNTNYVLLAEVVHRATGKPLSRFAEENIFKPLGMNQTRFYDDHSIVVPGRVAAYDPAGGGAFSVNWSTNYERVGDGGLMSSVEDLLLWDRNFYANKLGKGTLVQEILSRGVLNKGDKIGYALGLGISSYRGLPVVEHEGANFGYHTELLRFPEQQFSVICLCNLGSIDPELAATQVADIYLEGSFHDQPAGAQASDVERQALAGLYRNPENHSVAEVAVIAGGLQVRNIRMKQEGANHYTSLLGRFEARFEPMSQGGMKMLFGHSYTEPYIFERFQPIKASAEDLAQYAGDYASNELQATYRFRVKEQTLTLTINWTEFPPFFSPSLRDEFHAPDDTAIVFRRDAAGHIVGCDVYTDRVRKISLARK
jgi:CubicO group peptidase (beta-lactamase class C family)